MSCDRASERVRLQSDYLSRAALLHDSNFMTDLEWEQAKARGRRTSPALILGEEADNFFGDHTGTIQRKCARCLIPMKMGMALQGQEQDPNIRVGFRVYANQNLKFERCLKCPHCGFSETL